MPYLRYTLYCSESHTEILIALLADAGFDSFEETETGIEAYAENAGARKWATVLAELQQRYPFTFSTEPVPDKNWNAEWESHFEPIRIDDRLLIRASFHKRQPGIGREIVIDPKMAFGTGHHATTYLMCELLLDYFSDVATPQSMRVLDYGSGTGVLALLAKQLGANEVEAVDVERPAYESTLENAALNGVKFDLVVHGQLTDVPLGRPYDLVLANINRNVLLDTGAALHIRLNAGGRTFMSGVLAGDEALLVNHMQSVGFQHLETRARDDWRAFVFTRG